MCSFNPGKCTSSCPQYSMCAIKYSEQKFNFIEKRMSSLFEAINQLSENVLTLYKTINKQADSYSIKGDELCD